MLPLELFFFYIVCYVFLTASRLLGENLDLLPIIERVFNSVKLAYELVILGGIQYIQEFLSKFTLTKDQHLGFEAAAWY